MSIHHPLHPGPQHADEPTPLEQREFLSLMMARVADALVRPPFYVEAGLDLVSVCRLLAQAGQTNALVRDCWPGHFVRRSEPSSTKGLRGIGRQSRQ
jgi:hypothetical protein